MVRSTLNLNALDGKFDADVTLDAGVGDDLINLGATTGAGGYVLAGGLGTNTLTGTAIGHTWNVTAIDAGNLDGAGVVDFSQFGI